MAKPNEGTIDEALLLRIMVGGFTAGVALMAAARAAGMSGPDTADALEAGFKAAAAELADMLRRGLTDDEARAEMKVRFEAAKAEDPARHARAERILEGILGPKDGPRRSPMDLPDVNTRVAPDGKKFN